MSTDEAKASEEKAEEEVKVEEGGEKSPKKEDKEDAGALGSTKASETDIPKKDSAAGDEKEKEEGDEGIAGKTKEEGAAKPSELSLKTGDDEGEGAKEPAEKKESSESKKDEEGKEGEEKGKEGGEKDKKVEEKGKEGEGSEEDEEGEEEDVSEEEGSKTEEEDEEDEEGEEGESELRNLEMLGEDDISQLPIPLLKKDEKGGEGEEGEEGMEWGGESVGMMEFGGESEEEKPKGKVKGKVGKKEKKEEEEEEGEEEESEIEKGMVSESSTEKDDLEEEESEEIDIYEESSEKVSEEEEERKDEWRPSKRIIKYVTNEEGEEEVEEEEEGDFISVPELSAICSYEDDFLEFHHSFGYDCRKHYNLCVPEPETVVFASGNYINVLDVKSLHQTFRRSARGGGIGHIVKNPKYPHIAVGEKGKNPIIIIYNWPSMERVVILRGGSTKGFTALNYSPDGEFLCSQGKEPDYYLTVWRWKKGKILRQQKAYGQDVLNATFSRFNPSNLTTAGFAHIKFWKLAKTFTGIKLMGSIGRFGKTEMCDIIGFVALPDEQVISGCEWGNMLIWDEGLVKAEVRRKGGAPCHEGYISQLLFDDVNSEIITIGTDGYIRAWDFKLIEKADLTEHDNKITVEALHTFEVSKDGERSQLRYIEKRREDDTTDTKWYAQDANGGIWLLDLDQDHAEYPEKIFTCHAGPILSVACSPIDHHVATYGEDGKLCFYNYREKFLVMEHKFASGGGFMVWPKLSIEPSGCVLICGGSDGMIRVVVVALASREAAREEGVDPEFIRLVQTTKPHTMAIKHMAIHEDFKVLVTGSDDATIFVYQIVKRSDYMSLNPIGFVRVSSEVMHIECKNARKATILVALRGGEAVEMDVPEIPELYTKTSYELTSVEKRTIVFQSVKSQIRRDLYLEEVAKRKQEKVEIKKRKLADMRKENPHLKIDEDLFLEDSESEESLESLYFPPVPNPILFAKYVTEEMVWLSAGGYDAGYMYEYKFNFVEPFNCTLITDADDIELDSFVYDKDEKNIFLGLHDGRVRACKVKKNGKINLNDYWELTVHDNDNGHISQMCFSFDHKFFFSCGHDSNLFSFRVTSEAEKPDVDIPKPTMPPWPKDELEDIADAETFSLEQLKVKAEYDRKMKLANEHKQEVLKELKGLKDKFAKLVARNLELPVKLRIPEGDFIIDHRIEDDLDQELQEILDLEKRKIAFEAEKCALLLDKIQHYFFNSLESPIIYVHAIANPKLRAYTFRHRVLPNEFHDAKQFVDQKIKKGKKLEGQTSRKTTRSVSTVETTKPLPLGTWLKGLSTVGTNVKMNLRLQRMLLKYYERKRRMELRKLAWQAMMKSKPDPNVSHPSDVAAMEHAERTIGDYKLKTDPEYLTSGPKRVTMDRKFQQILATRKQIHDMQKEYSQRILALRKRKEELLDHIADLRKQLKRRHLELPEDDIKFAPEFPEYPWHKEHPEDELTLKEEQILAEYPKIIQLRKEGSADESEEDQRELIESDETISAHGLEHRDSASPSVDSTDEPYKLDSDYEILLSDGKDMPILDEEMVDQYKKTSLLVSPNDQLFQTEHFISDVDINQITIGTYTDDSHDTMWEQEMRYRRLCRSLYSQDEIIREIQESVEEFDEEVKEAKSRRFSVAVDVKFGELRLIKLHQEIIILKDFEAHEDILQAKVSNTEGAVEDERNKITDLEENIELRLQEIENLHVKEKQLLAVFNEAIEDNNYSDFLKKIYKKKYKPPREKKGEDDSSSESSLSTTSSSEDESYDSQDLDIIKLDESICPPDLDREIYDMTFKLRGERHKVEIQEADEKKMIELNKKEIEIIHKRIKNLERELDKQNEELREFQREKQNRLNEVMCTVTLKASQLQFFDEPGASLFNIKDKLVFSSRVLNDLENRVGELHKETVYQKKKLDRYKKHYRRMGIDCMEMVHIINHLKVNIDDTLIKKFGGLLKVDELEDIILQRMIQEMKSPLQELTDEFYRVAAAIKGEIRKKQNELTFLYVHNTEKMNVLAILEKERDSIRTSLHKAKEMKWRVSYKDLFEASTELKRLMRVIRNQGGRILMLKAEIRAFKYKDKPPPTPICTPSQYARDLKDALYDEGICKDIEDVVVEEEEEDDLFLYMEDARAMELLAARESLEEEESMPLPEDIIRELLRRVPGEEVLEDGCNVEAVLDSVFEELLKKIPPTDTAVAIFDELLELLLMRLDANKDNEGLQAVLWDIVVDMRSMSATPEEVRGVLALVFRNMKQRETLVSGALQARALLCDILRKCLGFVLGRRFLLSTEEALTKVLQALNEDESHALYDEVIRALEEEMDKIRDMHVKEMLADVVHHVESLQTFESPPAVFKQMVQMVRERSGPECAMAQARHVLHDALKKAMGIVTETENPLWEREAFDPDKALIMLLLKVPSNEPAVDLYDEIYMQIEWRDPSKDTPGMQLLMQMVMDEVTSEAPPHMDAMMKRMNKLLKELKRAAPHMVDLKNAYVALYDAARRSINYNFPAVVTEPIHRALEGSSAALALLDGLPPREDGSPLLQELAERAAHSLDTMLLADGVQHLLADIREELQKQAGDHNSDVKNVCADIFERHRRRDFKRKDVITTFRLVYDNVKYALNEIFPNINLQDDEDIMKAVQSVLHIADLVDPEVNQDLIQELMKQLSAWEPKRTDSEEVTEKVAIVIENLMQLPQGWDRLRRTFSHIFKLVYMYNSSKPLTLRVLGILRLQLKAAVREVVPNVKVMEDICHFNPDDTLLAMMSKVPISLYTNRVCILIRTEMDRMAEESTKVTPDIQKLFAFVGEYLQQVTEEEPDIYGPMEDALEDVKDLEIPPLENVYGRIYLNYIVRRAMSLAIPRVDIKEAACSIDKERPTILLLHKIPRTDPASLELWEELVEELQSRLEVVEDQPEVSEMLRHSIAELMATEPTDPDQAIHMFHTSYVVLKMEKVALLEMLTAKNIYFEALKASMERCFPLLDLDDSNVIDKELPIIQMLAQLPMASNYRNLVEAIITELQLEEAEMTDEMPEKELVKLFVDELNQGPMATGDLAHVYPCFAKIRDMTWPVKVFKDFKEVVYACIKRGIGDVFPTLSLQDNQSAWEHEESLLISSLALPDTDDPSPLIDEVRERLSDLRITMLLTDNLKRLLLEVEHHMSVMPMEPGNYEYIVTCILSVLKERSGRHLDIARLRHIVYGVLRDSIRNIADRLKRKPNLYSQEFVDAPEDYD